MAAHLTISPDLNTIAQKYNGILLDAYGVFWGGNDFGVLQGSKEAMEKLVADKKIVGILSNTTQLAAKDIDKLARHGIIKGKHFHFLVTSGEVARSAFLSGQLPFKTPRNTFWLLGGVHPKFSSHEPIFQGSKYRETKDIAEADFIYISIPHVDGEDQTDVEVFREQVEKLKQMNLPMVCSNPDLFAHEGKPPKAVVRQGSIAKLYEDMGGKVFYIGKPHSNAYFFALTHFVQFNIKTPKEILMVGDTPETDIRGANLCDMASALVTETGMMAERISQKGLMPSLNNLPKTDTPNYLIKRFAYGIRSAL